MEPAFRLDLFRPDTDLIYRDCAAFCRLPTEILGLTPRAASADPAQGDPKLFFFERIKGNNVRAILQYFSIVMLVSSLRDTSPEKREGGFSWTSRVSGAASGLRPS